MKLSTHAKSRIVGLTDQVTLLGLKLGIPVFVVAGGHLLYTAFGSGLRGFDKMTAVNQKYLAQTVEVATLAVVIACAVLVACIIFRLSREEATGQVLALAGLIFSFLGPMAFSKVAPRLVPQAKALLDQTQHAFAVAGIICLLPGLVLVLRDAIVRIWNGVSARRVIERRWGDEEERRRKHKKLNIYGSCWDMAFCRDFIRRVCPAFVQKKPCWRIKTGCYCDEGTILKAMAAGGTDNPSFRGIMASMGLDKSTKPQLSGKVKRARCRRCGIYSEHQRQKYRLISPMVFVAVGLAFYLYYGVLARHVWGALAKIDRVIAFLAYRTIEGYSFAHGGDILTTLAMIWLMIVSLSYALKLAEYLIFDLQV